MSRLSFKLGPALGHRANMGLIVLRTDETVEAEARQVLTGKGVAHYVSRVPCHTSVTLEGLATMEAEIPRAAALLPDEQPYDVVAYACTSGATSIGSAQVSAAIRLGANTRHTTDPLAAALVALGALNVRRLGFVTPYMPDVSDAMRGKLEAAGFEIAGFGSMEEENDMRVARIDAPSIRAAILTVCAMAPCDAVFLSCTNLRALALIPEIEAEVGVPVLTSNSVLLWHMMQLAGQPTGGLPHGALMRTGISAHDPA